MRESTDEKVFGAFRWGCLLVNDPRNAGSQPGMHLPCLPMVSLRPSWTEEVQTGRGCDWPPRPRKVIPGDNLKLHVFKRNYVNFI